MLELRGLQFIIDRACAIVNFALILKVDNLLKLGWFTGMRRFGGMESSGFRSITDVRLV